MRNELAVGVPSSCEAESREPHGPAVIVCSRTGPFPLSICSLGRSNICGYALLPLMVHVWPTSHMQGKSLVAQDPTESYATLRIASRSSTPAGTTAGGAAAPGPGTTTAPSAPVPEPTQASAAGSANASMRGQQGGKEYGREYSMAIPDRASDQVQIHSQPGNGDQVQAFNDSRGTGGRGNAAAQAIGGWASGAPNVADALNESARRSAAVSSYPEQRLTASQHGSGRTSAAHSQLPSRTGSEVGEAPMAAAAQQAFARIPSGGRSSAAAAAQQGTAGAAVRSMNSTMRSQQQESTGVSPANQSLRSPTAQSPLNQSIRSPVAQSPLNQSLREQSLNQSLKDQSLNQSIKRLSTTAGSVKGPLSTTIGSAAGSCTDSLLLHFMSYLIHLLHA